MNPILTPADPNAASDATVEPAPRRRGLLAVVLAILVGLVAAVLAVPQSASAITGTHNTTAYERSIEYRVLDAINNERRAHHLVPVTMDGRLILSSRRHDVTMAYFNQMSHQLPGEAYFATRMTLAGYRWHWAGENIAWNSQMNTAGVLALQYAMYNEKAPNNGHRLNILNPNFRNVGVDVYLDYAHHKVWLTTDFGRP